MPHPSSRILFFLISLFCVLAMAYALYAEYGLKLDPCPLCIFQRLAVIGVGVVAFLAGLINPRSLGRKIASALIVLVALSGAAVAGRQLWLQHLPADLVPTCGPGLNYMLETLPFATVLEKVLSGDGECAVVDWRFLGQSMPFWVLVFFIAVIICMLFQLFRRQPLENK